MKRNWKNSGKPGNPVQVVRPVMPILAMDGGQTVQKTGFRMHRFRCPLRCCATYMAACAIAMSGCVHLNIPSERRGDSESFHASQHGGPVTSPMAAYPMDPLCDEGALIWQDPEAGHATEPAAVPWPRFHPLPTRPVLGL